MRLLFAIVAVAVLMLACAAPAPGESRFPAAEPVMPMVTYYDPIMRGPLGEPIHEGALIVDPPQDELPS